MDSAGAVHPAGVDTSNDTGATWCSRLNAGNTGIGAGTLSAWEPSASGMSAPISRSCTWLGREESRPMGVTGS